jgi:hypothetical protein
MKNCLIIILVVIKISICFAQNPEQIAVDFYAQKFSKENKEKRIRFDGKIKNYGNELAEGIIISFYRCKTRKTNANNDSITVAISDIKKYIDQIQEVDIEFQNNYPEKLKIPDNFKYRKNLKYKKLHGGFIHYYSDKFWHWIFPYKYNFTVEPAVKFNDFYYVRLALDKNDSEYGSLITVKITNELKVIDWCEEWWIQ